MTATIICSECQTETPRVGRRQFYCPDCRRTVQLRQRAEAEQRRRDRHGNNIRARDRERYATDARVRALKKASAASRYTEIRADPVRYARWLEMHRLCNTTHFKYGGNRIVALRRDNFTCQACGFSAQMGMHIHHIDGKGSLLPPEEQNNELSNLITLCVSCHCRVHRLKEREERLRAGT